MRILALDLSTNTGWACGAIGGAPVHGTIRLPSTKKDIGRFAAVFEGELAGLIGAHHPDRVCFESPILPSSVSDDDTEETRGFPKFRRPIISIITARKLYGLAYHTELMCFARGIPCSETHMQTARATLGAKPLQRSVKDKAARRKHIKAEVMRLCRLQGWEPANDDEADALCVWWDACRQFDSARLRFAF